MDWFTFFAVLTVILSAFLGLILGAFGIENKWLRAAERDTTLSARGRLFSVRQHRGKFR